MRVVYHEVGVDVKGGSPPIARQAPIRNVSFREAAPPSAPPPQSDGQGQNLNFCREKRDSSLAVLAQNDTRKDF